MKNGPKKIATNYKINKEKKQIERKMNLLQGRVGQLRQSLLEQSKREISILHDRIEKF